MKLIIEIEVTNKRADIHGMKEDLAMYCEVYGDMRLVKVEDDSQFQGMQLRIWTGLEEDCPW